MFKSLIDLTTDVVRIAAAPVEVAVDLTRIATKPLADAAQEIVQDVKSSTKDDSQ